ncbi:MAG: hypothetical protein KC419_08225, partial [Anaerolineales bacterium]|nr:hypothetical protein [Anaerolineales bacterium]
YLESVNRLLLQLEAQRNIVRSGVGQFIEWLTNGLRRLLLRSRLQHPRLTPTDYDPTIKDSTEAAAKLLDLEQYDKELEKKRIRRTRLVAVILGTTIAYFLQVDSAVLLRDLFPDGANFLFLTLIPHNSALFHWIESRLSIPTYDLTAGVILTGLAASAGSSFWHDQLGRLQAVKSGVEAAEKALQPIIIQTQNKQE